MTDRSFWGWGDTARSPTADQQQRMASTIEERFGVSVDSITPAPSIDEIDLPEPRLAPPATLAALCAEDPVERAGHTYGKSFRDIARGLARDFSRPPDVVALPRDESHVTALLDWCADAGAAAIPYGGGSSVVGGVEPGLVDRPVVTIDLRNLDRVLEVDRRSRAARIQAGVLGPSLEDQLRPHGLTLRHFPQSFEFSTLGGWIATRSGGHFATLHTHIDDFVECTRTVTPRGVMETRRLPGSGAGPSPDRLVIGSEGTLGVITEAWMRLQDRPVFRAAATGRFASFEPGAQACRALAQSGLWPSNCRLLDATEAMLTGVDDGSAAVLLVAFESADHPLDASLRRAVELLGDHGAEVVDVKSREERGEDSRDSAPSSQDTWRSAFLRAPYTRDALVAMGMVNETFETACTWDAFERLHASVTAAVRDGAAAAGCGDPVVTCRFTHVYPDGPAPYFTVIAPGDRTRLVEQWDVVKAHAADAILAAGGTITHHHAVGRDHRPWYDRQRPDLFADALRGAKRAVDPAGIMNPGVLVDPYPGPSGASA